MTSEQTPRQEGLHQDAMLEQLCKEQTPVSIYLINGIRLHGHIVQVDRFSILLRDAFDQLVYKQAISTVSPNTGNHHRPDRPPRGSGSSEHVTIHQRKRRHP